MVRAYVPSGRLPVFISRFLVWVKSPAAIEAMAAGGHIAPDVLSLELADQQYRLSNALAESDEDLTLEALRGFVATFDGASRLSPTFRFEDGSVRMDARSRRNVDLLAFRIETGDYDGREIILAGFTDSEGPADGNRRLSRQRAERVLTALRAAAPRADLGRIRFSPVGLGELSPIACNDTDEGRRANRRVEIWVR